VRVVRSRTIEQHVGDRILGTTDSATRVGISTERGQALIPRLATDTIVVQPRDITPSIGNRIPAKCIGAHLPLLCSTIHEFGMIGRRANVVGLLTCMWRMLPATTNIRKR
jgi:hypothetical protein